MTDLIYADDIASNFADAHNQLNATAGKETPGAQRLEDPGKVLGDLASLECYRILFLNDTPLKRVTSFVYLIFRSRSSP